MPGFDGTGPMGQGPMTGRGFGYCVDRNRQIGGWFGRGMGYVSNWFGRFGRGRSFTAWGRGLGRGLGRGRRGYWW